MARVSYLIKRVFSMNFHQIREKVKEVRQKSSKSSVSILFDMLVCGIRYQAGYTDYALFEMYNLNTAQRKTVVTRGINNSFVKRFNNPAFTPCFEDKRKFNRKFALFLHRDWIDLERADRKALEEFLSKNPQFIAKPAKGMCGKGIEKLSFSDFESVDALCDYLKEHSLLLLEQIVVQNKVMSELHPYAVNTIRVITLRKDDRTHVVAAYLRIGNGKHVDNFNSGGMVVPVEEDRGEVIYPALDKKGEIYDKHPLTKVSIKGFKIPMWKEIIELVKIAGSVVPEVGLVGWDVALTDKGPLIIEGNDFPGHDIYGLAPHRKDGIGVLPKFLKIINS